MWWFILFLLTLLAASASAQPYTPVAQQVLTLAPQLEAFAGSKANFESLASGLRGGARSTGGGGTACAALVLALPRV
jgi:hypothetical protein